ncbi:hypothetical protein SNL152K_5784 [Streptomyces sp. NL15-2K]|nr:hypothetical protein SNL152K_5784 [Streptomyces sp. NL15-2K]
MHLVAPAAAGHLRVVARRRHSRARGKPDEHHPRRGDDRQARAQTPPQADSYRCTQSCVPLVGGHGTGKGRGRGRAPVLRRPSAGKPSD